MVVQIDNVWCFGFLLAILLRWTVAQFSYSGAGKPPMFGDYEAQRHWMEVTVNLPASDWYTNTTDNDLLYWGLDYPPATAYHSYINGKIAQYLNGSWVELNTSRGVEGYYHKLFMRSTVVDVLFYFSAVLFYWVTVANPKKPRDKAIAFVLTLIYPGLILIDHGHFQYNCVPLALVIWAIVFLMKDNDILASISFSLALNYKQMSLYYAFPFFFYFLGKINSKSLYKAKIFKFTCISLSVLATFLLCWIPFLYSLDSVLQVFRRVFPINRGIYEDKVANLWFSLSILVKIKNFIPQSTLVIISTFSTLFAVVPSSIHLLKNPNIKTLRYSLVNSSLLFFLFSYQVHEKTILFVAIPTLLLIEDHPLVTFWFVIISTFSLQPLLIKDGLMLPFFSLIIFYVCAYLNVYGDLQLRSAFSFSEKLLTTLFLGSMFGCSLLSLAAVSVPAPRSLPDIHAVLNAIYSCSHFLMFAVGMHYFQFGNIVEMYHSKLSTPKKLTKIKKKIN